MTLAKPITQTIVAMGGGGFSMEPENPLLDDWLLQLISHTDLPSVCFLPTASGDSPDYISRFYTAFEHKAACSHLSLFRRTTRDLEGFLLGQDLLYVGGGNTANMMAIWGVHGVDEILKKAWRKGVILAGLSAGSLCWFESGVTDSFGAGLAPFAQGLGFLPGSHCPHYDGEAERKPCYQALISQGKLSDGIAAEDGVALHFQGTQLHDVVASSASKHAHRVTRTPDGFLSEAIPATFLQK